MTKILHVSCSPRGLASESYRLSRNIIERLLEREPLAFVVDRVIGAGAMSHIDESYATALGGAQQSAAERAPEGAMARSEELIQELESSDYVVIGTPMHNFTIPSALKAWIDHVVRVRRTFNATKTDTRESCATVRYLSPCPRVAGIPASVRASQTSLPRT
jgi:FMN-dependent NADH-azoreductase